MAYSAWTNVPIFDTGINASFALAMIEADLNSHKIGGISAGVR